MENWPTDCLEPHVELLSTAIKHGMCDSDVQTELMAKKAFLLLRPAAERMMETLTVSDGVQASSTSSGAVAFGSHGQSNIVTESQPKEKFTLFN